MRFVAVTSLLLSLAIGPALAADVPAKPAADSRASSAVPVARAIRTPGGATFDEPAGFRQRRRGDLLLLTAPEGNLDVALLDVDAPDADAAMAAVWRAYERAGERRAVRVKTPEAASGWSERYAYAYATSPNEKLIVRGQAQRAGKRWVAVLLYGDAATFEKRLAAVVAISTSLRPGGHVAESFAGRTPHRLDAARVARITEFLREAMRRLHTPGIAFSLIDQDQVVFEGGLGVRELGQPEPVDADTLFIAASNTKAMTTMLLATLVDRGKLRWDQPVVEAYPAFRLGDAATTRQVQVRHLVCACTGMPRQDMEWLFEYDRRTPAAMMATLGTMMPTTRFGEAFQYSNLMAAAAGFVAGRLYYPDLELGAAYDRAMQVHVFDPIGMKRTTFDFGRAMAGNHARPHDDDLDGTTRVASMGFNDSIVPARPAGGVWTSARDLTRYVQVELREGRLPDGKVLVSRENVLARQAPQVASGEGQTYGMALEVDRRDGIAFVHHGGDLAGYHSDMFWLPGLGIGGTILVNADPGAGLRDLFARKVLEELFDGEPRAHRQLDAMVAAQVEWRAERRRRLVSPPDAAVVAGLASRYANDALGTIVVTREEEHARFDFGGWSSRVATRRNDDGTRSVMTIDPAMDGFEFVVGARDGRRTLVFRDLQHEYVFVETPKT